MTRHASSSSETLANLLQIFHLFFAIPPCYLSHVFNYHSLYVTLPVMI